MSKTGAILGGLLALCGAVSAATPAPVTPRVPVATSDTLQEHCDAIGIEPPWAVLQNLEPLGPASRLRCSCDRLYGISRSPDGIRVIDPMTFDTIVTIRLPRGTMPGDILVASPDRAYVSLYNSAAIAIACQPACGATDHGVIYGPLDQIGTYGCSGQVCGLGTGGAATIADPGDGSFFFLVVGTGEGDESGSCGAASAGAERPAYGEDPVCPWVQDLTFSCDR